MSIANTRDQAGRISSPFLQKFLGKVNTVSKSGELGESGPLADISNNKAKTSILKNKDQSFPSINKPSKHKSALLPSRLQPIKTSHLSTPAQHNKEQVQSSPSRGFCIETILPKNVNLEMDFKVML